MDREAEDTFRRLLDALGIDDTGDTEDVDALPLRMPVRDVRRFADRCTVLGRIETGRVRVGDRVLFSPSNKTASVASIEAWNAPAPLTEASAGRSIGLALDEQLVVERGETVSHEDRPPDREHRSVERAEASRPTSSAPGCSGVGRTPLRSRAGVARSGSAPPPSTWRCSRSTA